ncbi:type I restriction endonuclease [Salisaeta longa]|uniref:type I restriction endonuclease n=1 Tax=Salisaeta longa TaxID=503170 RepID=UPI0003B3AFB3|nr:type I restriction endonuclease [Salisaeta longa]
MDFIEQIEALSARVHEQRDHLNTEEATKNALVMPFIRALGYDVFNPREVVPEFTADFANKKGEKVDYAIRRDDALVMLFECKKAGAELSTDHAGQLFRYFHMTKARIGVLTNGVNYKFFSDLEEENKMDQRPFLELSLGKYTEQHVEELKRLRKSTFDLREMLEAAHDLKYRKALRNYLDQQWRRPEDDFVHFMAKQVYDGRVTQAVREQFQGIVQKSLHQLVHDKVSGRLKSALEEEEASVAVNLQPTERSPSEVEGRDTLPEGVVEINDDVVTTEEEMEGFRIVRAIMREVVDVDRVTPRDVKTYFGVLLDDNNRQPICRLHFNRSQNYIGLFDENKDEERVPIDSLDDIYNHADALQRIINVYDGEQ